MQKCKVCEITAILYFTQKFKTTAKNGRKKILEKTPDDSASTLGVKISPKKWWQNDFEEKFPVDSVDTLRVKTFAKITLSRTVSEINVFCVLCRNSRWPPKMAGNNFWEKSVVVGPVLNMETGMIQIVLMKY